MSYHSPLQEGAAAPPPPPPLPWAFAASYAQPLPPALQFDPATGFSEMVGWVQQLPDQHPQQTSFRINPHVATYPSGAVKNSWTRNANLSPAEVQEYKSGATRSTAAKGWPAAGSIGLVTSCVSSASAQVQGSNNWHTVAMARQGNEVWVHDPAYSAAAHAGTVKRVDGVEGTRMVHALVQNHFPEARGVYFQGPPTAYDPDKMECMGRSAQWVEGTVAGTLPWPPNKDTSGGEWTWHSRN